MLKSIALSIVLSFYAIQAQEATSVTENKPKFSFSVKKMFAKGNRLNTAKAFGWATVTLAGSVLALDRIEALRLLAIKRQNSESIDEVNFSWDSSKIRGFLSEAHFRIALFIVAIPPLYGAAKKSYTYFQETQK